MCWWGGLHRWHGGEEDKKEASREGLGNGTGQEEGYGRQPQPEKLGLLAFCLWLISVSAFKKSSSSSVGFPGGSQLHQMTTAGVLHLRESCYMYPCG